VANIIKGTGLYYFKENGEKLKFTGEIPNSSIQTPGMSVSKNPILPFSWGFLYESELKNYSIQIYQ
jgi:hypothetical protein